MSAILKLIAAGTAVVLMSAPVVAMDRTTTETAQVTAQEECRGWGVRCEPEILPEFCIAEDKCAVALPGSALIRYDARMDAAAGH